MEEWGGKRAGAGRRKGAERVSVLVRVLPETFRVLEALCNSRHKSRGEIIDLKILGPKALPVLH